MDRQDWRFYGILAACLFACAMVTGLLWWGLREHPVPTILTALITGGALAWWLNRPFDRRTVVSPVLRTRQPAELILVAERKDVRKYAVYDVTNLGHDNLLADIAFECSLVSRLHATLVREGEDFVIYDQGSRNGTWINGRRLDAKGSAVLQDGDIIELAPGAVRLRFQEIEDRDVPPPLRKWR